MRGLTCALLLVTSGALTINVKDKKEDFIWGTSTAAFQIEGFATEDGRQPSVWDEFAKPEFNRIRQHHTGKVATLDYKYHEEQTVPLLKKLGVTHYRMSISWTRILNEQTRENPAGKENKKGIDHYKWVIGALKKNNIEPVVTMWHWDTPQQLEVKHGGFLNRQLMPKFFGEYAKVLLREFGSQVKYWITLNEPLTVVENGYKTPAKHAPGRCGNRTFCAVGDDTTEPYLAAHTMLLAHGQAVQEWRNLGVKGDIGLALNGDWCEPLHPDKEKDVLAAERCVEWQSAWFFDPIWKGDYPETMRKMVGDRLPKFTSEERKLVQGSHTNMYFQNLYTGMYVEHSDIAMTKKCGRECDAGLNISHKNKQGVMIGEKSKANEWLYKYPEGLRKFQKWISDRYKTSDGQGVNIIVAENGWGEPDTTEEKNVYDSGRCNYYRDYIGAMSRGAAEDGVNVKGYFAWSLLDNFEWSEGYTTRFGLTFVDYKTQKRTPKMSYQWFANYVTPLKTLPKDGKLPECKKSEYAAFRVLQHPII